MCGGGRGVGGKGDGAYANSADLIPTSDQDLYCLHVASISLQKMIKMKASTRNSET